MSFTIKKFLNLIRRMLMPIQTLDEAIESIADEAEKEIEEKILENKNVTIQQIQDAINKMVEDKKQKGEVT
jgi:methyl-accepting chemotaxis protein